MVPNSAQSQKFYFYLFQVQRASIVSRSLAHNQSPNTDSSHATTLVLASYWLLLHDSPRATHTILTSTIAPHRSSSTLPELSPKLTPLAVFPHHASLSYLPLSPRCGSSLYTSPNPTILLLNTYLPLRAFLRLASLPLAYIPIQLPLATSISPRETQVDTLLL